MTTPEITPQRMTPEEEAEFKRRRAGRNKALGLVLVFFVILFYAITLVRM